MPPFSDKRTTFLTPDRDPGNSIITQDQRVAMRSPVNPAMSVDPDVWEAFLTLLHAPDLHPMLQEMAAMELNLPVKQEHRT